MSVLECKFSHIMWAVMNSQNWFWPEFYSGSTLHQGTTAHLNEATIKVCIMKFTIDLWWLHGSLCCNHMAPNFCCLNPIRISVNTGIKLWTLIDVYLRCIARTFSLHMNMKCKKRYETHRSTVYTDGRVLGANFDLCEWLPCTHVYQNAWCWPWREVKHCFVLMSSKI